MWTPAVVASFADLTDAFDIAGPFRIIDIVERLLTETFSDLNAATTRSTAGAPSWPAGPFAHVHGIWRIEMFDNCMQPKIFILFLQQSR